MEGEWGAYSRQPVWHFWNNPKFTTICGINYFPGSDYEKAPDDLTNQKLCKKCKARFDKLNEGGGK